ncbi:MAG: TatD family hydrolase, partial [Zoogloeaceae bacterium]|nr:TatD family hydrolase [Zoogloeaceae bacterium]
MPNTRQLDTDHRSQTTDHEASALSSVSCPLSPASWFDSHCHLNAPEFAADRDAVWWEACRAGVRGALLPAVSLADCAAVDACVERYAGCAPAYGIHPLFVMRAEMEDLPALAALCERKPPVAIGEIGLDGFVKEVDWARQETFFQAQLELARKFDLPVILHARRAVDAVLKHLRRIRVRGGIAHAFNGSPQQAGEFLRLGFKLGFGGSLTYAGSRRIRALAASLPDEALV